VYIIFQPQGINILWTILFYLFVIAAVLFFNRNAITGDLGYVYYATGRTEKGVAMCKKAYERHSRSVKAVNVYGVYLMGEGRADEAITVFTDGLKTKNTLIKKYLETNIAGCYWLKGEIDKAIELHEKILRGYTYVSEDLYTTLGYLYILKEDYENALKYTDKAIAEKETHGPAWDNMGQIYFKQGDYETAKEKFLKAVSLREKMADSNYYLGCIYEIEGDEDLAKQYFEKSLSCNFTAFTTVKKEAVEQKYEKYKNSPANAADAIATADATASAAGSTDDNLD